MLKKITNYCIYSLIFLFPLFFLPITTEWFNFYKIYLLFALTALGTLAWLGRMIFKEKRIKLNVSILDVFVLVFLFISFLSCIFSLDKISSLYGFYGRFWPSLLGILSFGLFYFLLTNHIKKENLDKVAEVFLLSSFLVSVLTYMSIFLKNNLVSHSYESISLFSAFVIVFIIPFLGLRKMDWKLYLILFSHLGLLILINFKTAWVVLVLSLLLFLGFSFWKRFFKENVNKLSLSIIFVLIGLVFLIFNPLQLSKHVEIPSEVLLTKKASFEIALQSIKAKPILGYGLSNFSLAFSQHKPDGFLKSPFWQIRLNRAGSHVAEIITTTGILGILGYLGLSGMFLLISYFFISSFKQEKIIILPFIIGFASVFLMQLFYYQTPLIGFLFWLMLGLGSITWGKIRQERELLFKDFSELGIVFSILFWVILIGTLFIFFNLSRYYASDVMYGGYLKDNNLERLEKASRFSQKRTIYHIELSKEYLRRFKQEIKKPEPQENIVANLVSLAMGSAQKGIKASENRVISYEMAGVVFRDIQSVAQGAKEQAILSFEKALILEPKNALLLTELGKLYLPEEKAREYFERAVEIRPDYIDANLQLVVLDDREGKKEEARNRLENLVKSNPASFEARFQLGRSYYNTAEYDEAKQQFERAITIFPNHSNSLYSLGLTYEKQGMYEKAIESLTRVLELNPTNEDVKQKIKEVEVHAQK